MEDVGDAQDLCRFENRTRVQRETLGVVGIISRRRAVERLAVEERRIIDEVELHPGMLSPVHDRAEPILIVEGYGHAGQQRFGIFQPGLFVLRQVNGNRMAQLRQRLG